MYRNHSTRFRRRASPFRDSDSRKRLLAFGLVFMVEPLVDHIAFKIACVYIYRLVAFWPGPQAGYGTYGRDG